MGVEPFITGAAVSAVLAQRLARKLCPHCAEAYQLSTRGAAALHVEPKSVPSGSRASLFYRKSGCPRCGQTGYRGRVGIFQFLEMSARLEQLASEKASRDDDRRGGAARRGCARCGRTGSRRSRPASPVAEELARVCSA